MMIHLNPAKTVKAKLLSVLADLIGYHVLVRTDLHNYAEHCCFSFREALNWTSCYPNADVINIYDRKSLVAGRFETR